METLPLAPAIGNPELPTADYLADVSLKLLDTCREQQRSQHIENRTTHPALLDTKCVFFPAWSDAASRPPPEAYLEDMPRCPGLCLAAFGKLERLCEYGRRAGDMGAEPLTMGGQSESFEGSAAYHFMEPRKASEGMSAAEIAVVLSGARAGNADAWGQLYRQYAPAIFRFCRRTLPSREDAEDATTEIFMKVREKIGQYDASRPFTAWLYKVATNHCCDMLRRRRIRQDLETGGELESLPLEHPDPSQLERLVTQGTSQQVRRALEQLPSRARMALVLRYYADMSYDDIAEALGVRRPFVGVLLLRARHQLRDVFAARGMADPRSSSPRGRP